LVVPRDRSEPYEQSGGQNATATTSPNAGGSSERGPHAESDGGEFSARGASYSERFLRALSQRIGHGCKANKRRGTALAPAGAGVVTMKSRYLFVSLLVLVVVGWRISEPAAASGAAAAPKAHMNMLQLMRAFPFPHANVLFDSQSKDPVGPEKKESDESGEGTRGGR
jgi:hypothetical protein